MIELGKFTGNLLDGFIEIELPQKETLLARPVMASPFVSRISEDWLAKYKDDYLAVLDYVRGNQRYPLLCGIVHKEDSPKPSSDFNQHFILTDKFRIWINDSTNKITIDTLDSGEILFGNENVSEPLVLGNKLKSYLDSLIDGIMAITVNAPNGPTSTPINMATFVSLKAQHATLLSQKVKTK